MTGRASFVANKSLYSLSYLRAKQTSNTTPIIGAANTPRKPFASWLHFKRAHRAGCEPAYRAGDLDFSLISASRV